MTLLEQQQGAIKQLTSTKSPTRELRTTASHSESWLDIMRDEIFNLILEIVNMRSGAVVASNSSTVAPIVKRVIERHAG